MQQALSPWLDKHSYYQVIIMLIIRWHLLVIYSLFIVIIEYVIYMIVYTFSCNAIPHFSILITFYMPLYKIYNNMHQVFLVNYYVFCSRITECLVSLCVSLFECVIYVSLSTYALALFSLNKHSSVHLSKSMSYLFVTTIPLCYCQLNLCSGQCPVFKRLCVRPAPSWCTSYLRCSLYLALCMRGSLDAL